MGILSRTLLGMAPEFVSSIPWLNSRPLTMAELRGKVVLIDFWTYSCVNCIRTLPGLKKLWEKYSKNGLVVIGIHAPEFDFEKDVDSIKAAVKKHGIKYPVAVDSDHIMWRAYLNQYWPAHYLVDKDGKISYTHFGEGGEEQMEQKIRELLVEAGHALPKDTIGKFAETSYGDITRETYLGSYRGHIGSSQVCTPSGCHMYVDQGEHFEGTPYLKGEWMQEKEFVEFKPTQEPKTGYLALKFKAKEVNLVMGVSGKSVEAEVLLDGKPLTKSNAGKDVVFKKKKSFVKVDHYDMYRLFNNKLMLGGELSVVPVSSGLRCYAYTFG